MLSLVLFVILGVLDLPAHGAWHIALRALACESASPASCEFGLPALPTVGCAHSVHAHTP